MYVVNYGFYLVVIMFIFISFFFVFFFFCFCLFCFFFFFHAEDGTRDGRVTGVQTCALPISYGITTIAAIALLAAKGKGGESDVRIDDLSGLSTSRPWLAFALTVSMLSLLGFPGTAGFMGKWYILIGAVATGHTTLAIILVLTSVASAGYYLPVVMAMYMKPATHAEAHAGMVFDRIGRVTLAVAVAAMLWFGVAPGRLFELSRTSGASLRAAPAMADEPTPASTTETTSAR